MCNKKAMLMSGEGSPYNTPLLNLLIGFIFVFIYVPYSIAYEKLYLGSGYIHSKAEGEMFFWVGLALVSVIACSLIINVIKVWKNTLKLLFKGDL